MEHDFFTNLPPEITINILSKLPVRTTMSCKCVCKSWRSLIETPEFVKSYKSVPSLAVFQGERSSKPYKVYELEDELSLEYYENSCNVVFNFSFPHPDLIHSSANGLLFLFDHMLRPHNLVVCNPVTRDCIRLPGPQVCSSKWQPQLDTFGFGVSKMTGQYKLVRIFHEVYETEESGRWRRHNESHCQVYTLGTGLWRSISPSGLVYGCNAVGASLNGNFHWLVSDLKGSPWISCFDLETELFSTFSPPHLDAHHDHVFRALSALRDCLGLCDNSSKYEIVIWLMNTYGDEKSWTKQFVISKRKPHSDSDLYGSMCAIKVFKDGDILIKRDGNSDILCYSNKTKTIQVTGLIESHIHDRTSAVCYTPSFLPLKTFPVENVSSF